MPKASEAYHQPVMLTEVLEGLKVRPGGTYIDATVGGGGYAWQIVARGGNLLGIDQDPDALGAATQRLEEWKRARVGDEMIGSWKLVQGNFRTIEQIAKDYGFEHVDGILFDLGVSSHQIDTPDRGFSFRYREAPLDMRMDTGQGKTAAQYVEHLSQEELYEIFATYGEEKFARAIARALVRARGVKPVMTVGDLVGIVETVVGGAADRGGTLARVFQGLRILVNDELQALKTGIPGAVTRLRTGGRLVVLSYQSLEDRIIKREMGGSSLRAVHKRPVRAPYSEIQVNSRSRSAKLRIAEKL